MKNLLKNPAKGGIPAKENIANIIMDLTGVILLCDLICNIWHGLLPSVQRRGQRFSSPLALLRLYNVAVLSWER